MEVSADGLQYLRASTGQTVPSPYSRRWLPPLLLGPYPWRWIALTYASLAVTPFAAWWYFGAIGLVGATRVFAAALLSCLPGVWRVSVRFPILTDAPCFALSLVVAALAAGGHPILAAILSLPLGASRESAPVFAAVWAWSPWPLGAGGLHDGPPDEDEFAEELTEEELAAEDEDAVDEALDVEERRGVIRCATLTSTYTRSVRTRKRTLPEGTPRWTSQPCRARRM